VASTVIHADLERYLTQRFRTELDERPEGACQGVDVDRREPEPESDFPARLVIIRDDSGPDTSVVSAERSVGISFLAETEADCMTLSLVGAAIARTIPGLEQGNPVAAVIDGSVNGPFWVAEEQPRFRRYMTITYVVAGTPF
jgi:hypothetical protein